MAACGCISRPPLGDVDGDGVFNVGDSLQVQLIALGESDCAVSAMCPWRQQQANPTRERQAEIEELERWMGAKTVDS